MVSFQWFRCYDLFKGKVSGTEQLLNVMFPLHESAPETAAGPVQEQFVGRGHVGRMRSVCDVYYPKTRQPIRVVFVVVTTTVVVVVVVVIIAVAIMVAARGVAGNGRGDASRAEVRRRRPEYGQELIDQRRLVVVGCVLFVVGRPTGSRRWTRRRSGRVRRRIRRKRGARGWR